MEISKNEVIGSLLLENINYKAIIENVMSEKDVIAKELAELKQAAIDSRVDVLMEPLKATSD